ncbi:MAG: phosphoglycerate dehydrogenase [bacterium]
MKILISDSYSPKGVDLLKNYDGLTVDVKTGLSEDELVRIIKEYDGLLIRSNTKVSARVIEAADKLKVIGRAGIGLDNVDIPAASRKGIVVMNTPGGNNVTTAEHTVSMLMSVSRNIPQASRSLKQGKWEKSRFMGAEVFQKTAGIIGLGRIGVEVCERLKGFGMTVLVYDPFISKEVGKRLEVEPVELDELFRRSDYITVHTPLLPDTRHIINQEAFSHMKDGVFIINCARGGIVDEKALEEAINSDKVAGAALDVFEEEPPPDNHPLRNMAKVICTPHLGASTREAQDRVAVAVCRQAADYLTKGIIANAVNLPSIPPESCEVITAYASLAERLGTLAGQLLRGHMEEISLTYAGEVLSHNTSYISVSAVKGVLSPILKHSVNYVNALPAAKERQINIMETKKAESQGFASLITLGVKTDQGTTTLAGTLFDDRSPRLVSINNVAIEVELSGELLVVENDDVPGVVGALCSRLATHDINIGGMQLGLAGTGRKAISFINVDGSVEPAVIAELEKVSHVSRVRYAVL